MSEKLLKSIKYGYLKVNFIFNGGSKFIDNIKIFIYNKIY